MLLPTIVRGHKVVEKSEDANNRLNRSRSRSCVTSKAFRARNGWDLLSKDTPNGCTFAGIIVWSACAVSINILNIIWLQLGHLQGFVHREESSLTILGRSRLVKSITSIAVTADYDTLPLRGDRVGLAL